MPRANRKDIREVGHIDRFFTGIAKLRGLPHVFMHEVLVTEDGKPAAIVVGFDADYVEALFFDEYSDVDRPVYRSGELFTVPVGKGYAGRIIDGLGMPKDGLAPVKGKAMPVFRQAPPIILRDPVTRPLITGVKMVDAALPIGRGQRELIIGDRRVGKSTVAQDAVLHQKGSENPVHCIYVLSGQKRNLLSEVVALFEKSGAMSYTTIVAAAADDPYAAQYLAPFVGCTIAEYYRDKGEDALIVYDDLSKHAKAYRNISLLLERAPGRETYPADVFSLHAGLLERAAQMSGEKGGGSLTALPIIETQEGDISAYVPTNLISITDGQIYFERGYKERGLMPAINVGLSVSRLGGQVQPAALKKVAAGLRLSLAQHRELQKLTRVDAVVSKETQQKMQRGDLIVELLRQDKHYTVRWEEQVVLIWAVQSGEFDAIDKTQWRHLERIFLDLMRSQSTKMLKSIRDGKFDDDIEKEISVLVDDFKEQFIKDEPAPNGDTATAAKEAAVPIAKTKKLASGK